MSTNGSGRRRAPAPPPLREDDLTIGEELLVLREHRRPERRDRLVDAGWLVPLGTFADLILSGRAELQEVAREELGWRRRLLHRNDGVLRFRLRARAGAGPTGEPVLDDVLGELPTLGDKDLPQLARRFSRDLSVRFARGLRERGLVEIDFARHSVEFVDHTVRSRLSERLRAAIAEPERASAHTAVVMVLARTGGLFERGSGERQLLDPLADAKLEAQTARLADHRALAGLRPLVAAQEHLQVEELRKSTVA